MADAAFQENELENIESELKVLEDAEGIKAALLNIQEQLKGDEIPVVQVLRQLVQQLQPFRQHQAQVAEIADRLQAACIELNDIAGEASRLNDQVGHDAGKIEQLNERLNLGNKLLKKHNARQTEQLLHLMDDSN